MINQKKKTLKQNWYAGDTLNTGVGQGYALTTPLQLAVMTARIASNGRKFALENFNNDAAVTSLIQLIRDVIEEKELEQMINLMEENGVQEKEL